jgi:copper chaperone
MKTLKISIPNMQSTHCQMRVRDAISTVEGVALQSTAPGIALVSLETESQQAVALEAIQKAGYKIGSIEQKETAA